MGGSSIRHRSHSIGAGDLRTSLLSTLPRPLPPVTAAQAREAPPTDDINNSNESVLMDVSAFIRKSPNRSPSRSRKVQSMFVESNLTTAHIAQNVPESQGIFPYDLPSLSPPSSAQERLTSKERSYRKPVNFGRSEANLSSSFSSYFGGTPPQTNKPATHRVE